MKQKVLFYTRFERLWHWLQAFLILSLAVIGFEIHGTYSIFGFSTAVEYHNYLGLSLIGLYIFWIFWLMITGQWRQYVPSMKGVYEQTMYYISGIFKGAPHPTEKTPESKLNPMQKVAYFVLVAILIPLQLVSGALYLFYNEPEFLGIQLESLQPVAILHTLVAFLISTFVIAHIYLTTTGHTLTAYIKGMVTGYEEVDHK